MNLNRLQIISIGSLILSAAAQLLSNFVEEKKMDELVDNKVKEALANQNKEES